MESARLLFVSLTAVPTTTIISFNYIDDYSYRPQGSGRERDPMKIRLCWSCLCSNQLFSGSKRACSGQNGGTWERISPVQYYLALLCSRRFQLRGEPACFNACFAIVSSPARPVMMQRLYRTSPTLIDTTMPAPCGWLSALFSCSSW